MLALTMAASFACISASASDYRNGDVDGSGKIDIEDVAKVINHINGVRRHTAIQENAADINESGDVDIEDAVLLINYINGVIVSPAQGKRYYAPHYSFSAPEGWSAGVHGDDAGFDCGYDGLADPRIFTYVGIKYYDLSKYDYPDVYSFANEYTHNYVQERYSDGMTVDTFDYSAEDINGYSACSYGIHQYYYLKGFYANEAIGNIFYMKNGDNVIVIIVNYAPTIADKMEKDANSIIDSIVIDDD